mmetsp:Transcript_2486/g.6701  ORF Transcript_2486/g.6701 Transcript_2486/m.6701 type:complete len:275 (+) Transcript_2486:3-827(+)
MRGERGGIHATPQDERGGLITWKVTPINGLFWDSSQTGASVPLTAKEKRDVLVKGPEKQIRSENTRLPPQLGGHDDGRAPGSVMMSPSPSLSASGSQWGRSSAPPSQAATPTLRPSARVRGAGQASGGAGAAYLRTPSVGADESPFMTWGEIDGTPIRIDGQQPAPGGSTPSPSPSLGALATPNRFNIKPLSQREQIARRLGGQTPTASTSSLFLKSKGKARRAGKSAKRESKGEKQPLSEAGLRLARRLGKTPTPKRMDMELRASYTPQRPNL